MCITHVDVIWQRPWAQNPPMTLGGGKMMQVHKQPFLPSESEKSLRVLIASAQSDSYIWSSASKGQQVQLLKEEKGQE